MSEIGLAREFPVFGGKLCRPQWPAKKTSKKTKGEREMRTKTSSNGLKMGVLVLALMGLMAGYAAAAVIQSVTAVTKAGKPYSQEVILANINSAPGADFDPAVLSADIQRLYKTGLFRDIEVKVNERPGEKVEIAFTVEPVARVQGIFFEGNEEVKNRTLARQISLRDGDLLDPVQVARDTTAIRDYYMQKGFYGVKVAAIERALPETNAVQILWKITEPKRYKVREVNFAGNAVFTERKLLKSMRTRYTFWSRFFAAGYFSQDVLDTDLQMLSRLYALEGYLDFEVTEVKKNYSDNGKWIYLTIFVNEGQSYTVDSVAIEGNRLFGTDELTPLLTLKAGTGYTPAGQEADVEAIENKYRPLGYIDMNCQPVVEKDQAHHVVRVVYRITEGAASTVRDIYIGGNVVTKDEVIRRELQILPDDLADTNKIKASTAILRNLNYFESVVITPKSTPEPDLKDIDIQVTEKRTGQLMLGAGISSEDAIVGTLEVTQTNFDITNWPRFTGGGQRMRLRLQLGTERDEFLVSFVEPWWRDRRLRLEVSAFRNTRDQEEYEQEAIGFDTGLTWGGRRFWRHSAGLRVQQIELTDFEANASAELLAEAGDYTSVMLVYSLSRDTRDRFINPTRGTRLQLNAEVQTEALGGYTNLYRLEAKASRYYPVFTDSVVRVQGEIGVVDNIGGDPVAIFDRYFAGGSSTFRGFDRREVSPVDVNEDPVGGQSLLLGTVEYIHPFTDAVRGSIFTDLGNVWRDAYEWNPADLNLSVGVGVSLELPIGPIRLEYGFPVITAEDHLDTGGRLHFNLGYYF
jgi:outer membrane protein insertion porin family